MSDNMNLLDTVVVKRYGTGTENNETAVIVSICNAPTFGLVDAAGHRYDWRQDLTRPATVDETIAYWESRALNAERANECPKP